jgi:aminoglycoside phosphotransferase (APT) family kinase protein
MHPSLDVNAPSSFDQEKNRVDTTVTPTTALASRELIDRGFCSDVFAWGDGRVLKLLHPWVLPEIADREFVATRAVHAAGLPAPAAYDVIEVEGRRGIIFERVNGVSLLAYTQKRPWAIFQAVRELADLHAAIHRVAAPDGLPLLRDRIAARIEAGDATDADKQAARDQLAALPGGNVICHGDFHPANVLITARGFKVIDWSSASRGNPIGDVACTSRLLRTAHLPPWAPGYMHFLLRCLRQTMHGSYLNRYFRHHAGSRGQIDAWQAPIAVAARSWSAQRERVTRNER